MSARRKNPRLSINVYQLDNYIEQLYKHTNDEHFREFLKDLRSVKGPIGAKKFGEILSNLENLPNSNVLQRWSDFVTAGVVKNVSQSLLDKTEKTLAEICSEYFLDHPVDQTKVNRTFRSLIDQIASFLRYLYTQAPAQGQTLPMDAYAAISNLERFINETSKIGNQKITLKLLCQAYSAALKDKHTLLGSFITILPYAYSPPGWSLNEFMATVGILISELDPFKRPALWRCFKSIFRVPCVHVDHDLKTYIL